MGAATHQQTSFHGGEWSQSAQGRTDLPTYHFAMNACLNSLPTEQGDWRRRPGFQFAGTTRGGTQGRVISFDFKQAAPYDMEFTSNWMRFRLGPSLVMTNDQQAVVAISSANPAVVQVASAWPTGATVMFNSLTANNPLLQNRQFTITNIDGTHFSLQDAISGANIDGSTLGGFVAGNVTRVYEIATPYTNALWPTLRSVPADIPTTNATTPGAVLLQGSIKPYVLQVLTPPTSTAAATFSLGPAVFKDGPYFDPVPGGTTATPSAKLGNITLALSFPAYDATRSYSVGDYVTSAAINYKSRVDANLANTPVTSPSQWVAVGAGDAIGPNGFQGTDVGRHVRMYSEPAIWLVGTSYFKGDVVAYGGTGPQYIGATYWKSLVDTNVGNVPGVDLTKWALFPTGAIWTWGRITALTNIISGSLAGSVAFGNMNAGGGTAAAFDGVISKNDTTSASINALTSGVSFDLVLFPTYIGKNYSGSGAQQIAQAIIYPSANVGFGVVNQATIWGIAYPSLNFSFLLRAKQTPPLAGNDGTLLGGFLQIGNTTGPITITSSDQVTAWNYVWIEMIMGTNVGPNGTKGATAINTESTVSQIQFISPTGTGTSQGVTVQVVGDPLLYTTPIRTWRVGLFSDTTGWPTCGTYHEGRLWLSGVIGNRIDASKSNDPFNFAPTNPDGSVSNNNGISYSFNAPDVNPIFWMTPDQLGIVCGTQAGEWLVQATQANLALTPTTIQAHRNTTNQCANIEPRRTDITLAVVQSYKRELLEYFADVFSGKFIAQDLASYSKHMTVSGIQEIGCQQELTSVLWARRGDGALVGCTYKRRTNVSSQEAEIKAWHRHVLGSGRTVESIAISATADGSLPTLAMVTTDPTTGVRHVEVSTKLFEETDTLASAWFLDDAVNPTSVVSSTIAVGGAPYGTLTLNGLWHLNGATVSLFAGGLDVGDFTVTNGSMVVPYGDGISAGTADGLFTAGFIGPLPLTQFVVGFTYNSDGQIVRPATAVEAGARNGPPAGKLRRHHWYTMQVVKTAGLSIGTDFTKMLPVLFKDATNTAMPRLSTYTGFVRGTLNDDYSLDSMICWRVSRPLPAIVASIGGALHTQDI